MARAGNAVLKIGVMDFFFNPSRPILDEGEKIIIFFALLSGVWIGFMKTLTAVHKVLGGFVIGAIA